MLLRKELNDAVVYIGNLNIDVHRGKEMITY